MITHIANANESSQRIGHRPFGILRLLTCGSVDDGKSTLIGRLLLETGAVYDDHLQSLQLETKRHGTTQLLIDPSLLVDGLEDERAQGITIDIAYRYIRSPRRKIIIADSPGHEQYTRNMVTAASRADVALILVDARKGILRQTKRHAMIASLLGIKRFILAVNKMDLIEDKKNVYERISNEFSRFVQTLGEANTTSIPLSGLCGDNVCRRSNQMPWYHGATLLEALEAAPDIQGRQEDVFRFPIQRVVRPDSEFRGVSGTVVSGVIRPKDPIIVLPQRQRSTIRSIVTMDGEHKSASVGQAVTITLEDEIDLSRGDWIVSAEDDFQVSHELEARLVWMSQEQLETGKSYFLRCATKVTTAEVTAVQSVTDIDTGRSEPSTTLTLNEIGECHLVVHEPIVHDCFADSRDTGAFILVDRISHETVAAGIILRCPSRNDDLDLQQNNGTSREKSIRQVPVKTQPARMRHAAITVLVRGKDKFVNASIARQLESKLFEAAIHVVVVDEKMVDGVAADNFGSSSSEGSNRLTRMLTIARLLNDLGIVGIVVVDHPVSQTIEDPIRILGQDRILSLEVDRPKDDRFPASSDPSSTGPLIFTPNSSEREPLMRVVTGGSRIDEAIEVVCDAVVSRAQD